ETGDSHETPDRRASRDGRRTDVPAHRPPAEMRVAFAPGSGRDEAPAVIRVEAGASSAVDLSGRRSSLTLGEAPRARLTAADGSHALLLGPLPDARRAAAGIARVE